MYHCRLSIYLIGKECRIFKLAKKCTPLENFTHEFVEMSEINESCLDQADVLFVNLHNMHISKIQLIIESKKEEAELILLADKSQVELISYYLKDVHDVWTLPMSDSEINFRLLRWQKNLKRDKDYWQTNQYLETTINGAPTLIWYKTKDGLHEKVNDSFCKVVNKTKQQIEGRDHYYIWDVDPEEAGTDCMKSDNEVMEKRMTCVSGEAVNTAGETRLLTTYKSPLYDIDGSVMGTVGIGIDVTQERAYEQEILNRNRTMEAIFTALDCGVLCHSLDGKRIINMNNAALRMLGYKSEKELMEKGFDMIVPSVVEADRERLVKAFKELKNEGDSTNIEYRVMHDDGEIVHLMGDVKLVKENGELFYQRFLLDCTEQKLQEKQNQKRHIEMLNDALSQANKASRAKSEFLSNMSHDIRTPMNAIVGYTTLAASNIDNKDAVIQYLNKIKSSSNHLLELLNNVLDMNRIESGKMQLKEVPCKLSEVLDGLNNIVYADTQNKNIDFSIDAEDIKNDNIFCDKLRLNQVLINILGNSIKYTNEGGFIKLKVTEKISRLTGYKNYEFRIKDNGIGMSKEFLERVFEPFEREYNTTLSGVQGTGLGLAITKNIVDMMNGNIDIKSEQGVGTEVFISFIFRLNSDNDGLDGGTKQERIKDNILIENIDTKRRGRILLAEDNEMNQEIAVAILENIGYVIDVAANGQIAVDMLKNSTPGYYSFVLMDIQMPVMNGYEAAGEIRRLDDKALAMIPILAMTANAFEEDRQMAMKNGMNGHVAKPIDVEKLLAAIDKCAGL